MHGFYKVRFSEKRSKYPSADLYDKPEFLRLTAAVIIHGSMFLKKNLGEILAYHVSSFGKIM